jgi:hypothetical protein
MLETLGVDIEHGDNGIFTGVIPRSLQGKLCEEQTLRITFANRPSDDSAIQVTADSEFLRSLIAVLQESQPLPSCSPRHQPESVRDVSGRLFERYEVTDGSVHLSGCTLENRALLRITSLERDSTGGLRLSHCFTGLTGEPFEPGIAAGLKLDELQLPSETVRVSPDQRRRWRQAAETAFQSFDESTDRELLLITAIWCKFAEGKLSFAIEDSTAELAFSGWAGLLAAGEAMPPPYMCSETGRSSYHLVRNDDGEIAPAEAVATCSESGRRVLENRLETCAATGATALPKYFASCPVSETRVLESALETCQMCQQLVSPTATRFKLCSACRSLRTVSKDDPRMARILGEFPKLDHWRRWRIAETKSAYVLTARALIKRLLLVIDRQSLEVLRLATGSALSKLWTEAPEVDRAEYLHRDM